MRDALVILHDTSRIFGLRNFFRRDWGSLAHRRTKAVPWCIFGANTTYLSALKLDYSGGFIATALQLEEEDARAGRSRSQNSGVRIHPGPGDRPSPGPFQFSG